MLRLFYSWMVIRRYLLILSFSLVPFYFFAQSKEIEKGAVTYSVRFTQNASKVSERPGALESGAKDFLDELGYALEQIELTLEFNKELSKFSSREKSVHEKDIYLGFVKKLVCPGVYYINRKTNDVYVELEPREQGILVHSQLDKIQWVIKDSTKFVGRYLCKMATATYSVSKSKFNEGGHLLVAWYTDEVPVNLGPLDFGNLPGLILELDAVEFNYTVNSLDLMPLFTDALEMPIFKKIIPEEVYNKKLKASLGRQ